MTERVKIHSNNWVSLVVSEMKDSHLWYKYCNLPKVAQYLWDVSEIYSKEWTHKYYEWLLNKGWTIVFSIYEENIEDVTGLVLIRNIDFTSRKCELAIIIFDDKKTSKWSWTKALLLMMKHAFWVLGLNKIYLQTLANNDRAIACYKKCWFHEVWRFKKHTYLFWEYHDEVLMEIFNSNIN